MTPLKHDIAKGWLELFILVSATLGIGLARSAEVSHSPLLKHDELLRFDVRGVLLTNASALIITPADLAVSDTLPYTDQLRAHARILDKLAQVERQASANLLAAVKAKHFADVAAAGEDLENNRKALVSYSIAQGRAEALTHDGYRLTDLSGKACRKTTCTSVEPEVAMFFFSKNGNGLSASLKTNPKPGNGNSDDGTCPSGKNCSICINGFNICNFIDFLSDKPLDVVTFGALPWIRERILQEGNGEMAQLIRDPGKRLLEIIQKARDLVVPANDNGELAKILRDPIKCTVGRLWGACDQ